MVSGAMNVDISMVETHVTTTRRCTLMVLVPRPRQVLASAFNPQIITAGISSLKLDFNCTNNQAEYEALLVSLSVIL